MGRNSITPRLPTKFRTSRLALAVLAGCVGGVAAAQQPVSDVVTVSASRIKQDGFSAPTPVSVLSEDYLDRTAPVDISEALSQVPQFSTTSQPSTAVQYASLRDIGANRTLFLLDGRRHVPTYTDGVVDLTTIPTALVSRTEIVTGGASASWGSDAVAGVVNLILKEDLVGIEGTVQGGISDYSDDETTSASVAGGFNFANGNGHVLAGVEYAKAWGIPGFLYPDESRPYGGRGRVSNSNFANAPQFIYAEDVRRADVYDGGIITSGPLQGTIFLPDGVTGQFQYGERYGNNMIGGGSNPFEPPDPGGNAKAPYERFAALTRINYQFTDALAGYAEFNYSRSISNGLSILGRNQGTYTNNNPSCTTTRYTGPRFGNIAVPIDNAFLPASLVNAMTTAGINCFNFGRSFREEGMGYFHTSEGSPNIYRGVLGLEGDINDNWSWDAYVQYGDASFQQRREGNIHSVRFQAAADAVRDVNGNIVCRINIDANTANDDSACVPFNMFGAGAPSPAAIAYVTGTSMLDQDIEQLVGAFNVQGAIYEGWAGDWTLAAGAEYRKEEVYATVDPDSEATRWQTSNRQGIEGDYDVKELYGELAVPLVRDKEMAQALDLNLALRYTDYSSSGGVTTWKAGATWELNDQVRLRGTYSRDIRAGNLNELFAPRLINIRNITNPLTSVTIPVQIITSGNPEVAPEKADTITAGIVLSPDFAPGLQMSLDYYNIDISGQIGTVGFQDIVDQCFIQNVQVFCDQITLTGNTISSIDIKFLNLDRFQTSGLDIEASYNFDMDQLFDAGRGNVSMRVLATYVDERKITFLTNGSVQETAGEFQTPHWKVFWQLNYSVGDFRVGLDWRWYGGGNIDNDLIEGFNGPQGTNINDLPSVHYTALNAAYDLPLKGDSKLEFFLRVDNLFDKAPPFPLRNAFNDNYGRGYRAGIRFAY
ncbi:MAG: TonB-dependent receptor [Gammaproteobacteria bacterium]|nr:TonB-dependent receptor [Gammaproteobacteria bacterium]